MSQSTPNQHQKRTRPLGVSLSWTSVEIEHLSLVSDADKRVAAALWRNEAPHKYRNLLQAVETTEGK